MKKKVIAPFHVIGLTKRTINKGNQAMEDIGALWQQWQQEQVSTRIPERLSSEVYCLYTNYENDYLAPYDVILGHKVPNLATIPSGLVRHTVIGGMAIEYLVEGAVLDKAVGNTWYEIWQSKLERAYECDFEVYSPDFSKATIYVGIQ